MFQFIDSFFGALTAYIFLMLLVARMFPTVSESIDRFHRYNIRFKTSTIALNYTQRFSKLLYGDRPFSPFGYFRVATISLFICSASLAYAHYTGGLELIEYLKDFRRLQYSALIANTAIDYVSVLQTLFIFRLLASFQFSAIAVLLLLFFDLVLSAVIFCLLFPFVFLQPVTDRSAIVFDNVFIGDGTYESEVIHWFAALPSDVQISTNEVVTPLYAVGWPPQTEIVQLNGISDRHPIMSIGQALSALEGLPMFNEVNNLKFAIDEQVVTASGRIWIAGDTADTSFFQENHSGYVCGVLAALQVYYRAARLDWTSLNAVNHTRYQVGYLQSDNIAPTDATVGATVLLGSIAFADFVSIQQPEDSTVKTVLDHRCFKKTTITTRSESLATMVPLSPFAMSNFFTSAIIYVAFAVTIIVKSANTTLALSRFAAMKMRFEDPPAAYLSVASLIVIGSVYFLIQLFVSFTHF